MSTRTDLSRTGPYPTLTRSNTLSTAAPGLPPLRADAERGGQRGVPPKASGRVLSKRRCRECSTPHATAVRGVPGSMAATATQPLSFCCASSRSWSHCAAVHDKPSSRPHGRSWLCTTAAAPAPSPADPLAGDAAATHRGVAAAAKGVGASSSRGWPASAASECRCMASASCSKRAVASARAGRGCPVGKINFCVH